MPLPAPFSATSNSLRAPSHQRAIGGMFWVQGVLGDGGREPPSCSPSRREGVMEPGVLSVMEGGAQIQRTMSTVVGRGPWNACGSWPRAGNRPSWVQMGRVWLWAGSPGTSWRSTEPSFTGWRDTGFPWPFVCCRAAAAAYISGNASGGRHLSNQALSSFIPRIHRQFSLWMMLAAFRACAAQRPYWRRCASRGQREGKGLGTASDVSAGPVCPRHLSAPSVLSTFLVSKGGSVSGDGGHWRAPSLLALCTEL